jgi:phosphoglycerate dehydrogenase-like enzyme
VVKPIVFVARRLPGGALDPLAQHTNLEVWEEELPPPRRELLRQAARCHGLLTLLTDRVDDELLEGAPHLVAVSNMATGFDNIDVAAASRRSRRFTVVVFPTWRGPRSVCTAPGASERSESTGGSHSTGLAPHSRRCTSLSIEPGSAHQGFC